MSEIEIIEVKDVTKMPKSSIQFSGNAPVEEIAATMEKRGVKVERIYRYSNEQGNWRYQAVEYEKNQSSVLA